MTDDVTECEVPTRRDTIKYGGAVVGGGLLAGCAGDSDGPGDESSTEGGSYTVEMAPVGEVTFESVPEQWVAYDGGYADMAVALGQADGITGIGGADRYYSQVYDELPGVSVDRKTVEAYPEIRTKEEFYELDNDVHLYDPEMLKNWFDWDQSDIDEIADNVAPFIGNLIFRRSDKWHDYQYYTLYEAFEKIAEVFQQGERYREFAALHDEFITDIKERIPPESDRPEVFLTYGVTDQPEEFTPYRLDDLGTSKKQWRDLNTKDVLADTDVHQQSTTEDGDLDYEGLLDLDPDVILFRNYGRKTHAEFRNSVLAFMQDHPVGSQLTAVQNERIYRGGYLHQGPIHNLFLTERAAKQLYPDEFGSVTSDEQLFDRQRVADIINGDF